MSDDWARNYVETYKQKQQEKQEEQRRADLTEAGAPPLFQRIKERIRQDLQTLHDAGVLESVKLQEEDSAKKFVVTSPASPRAELEVELSGVLIMYQHVLFRKERPNRPEGISGELRICSDLTGLVQVYRDSGAFADESEVSEFLLTPLLDHING